MNIKKINPQWLKPHPRNYNKHTKAQINHIVKSIKKYGQYRNIVVWNGYIIAGHGFVEAAIKCGLNEIEVNDVSDIDENTAIALMVSDNYTAIKNFDTDILADIIGSYETVNIPGVDGNEIQRILGRKRDEVIFDNTNDTSDINNDGNEKGTKFTPKKRVPLPIVVTTEQKDIWDRFKLSIGEQSDSQAFAVALERIYK